MQRSSIESENRRLLGRRAAELVGEHDRILLGIGSASRHVAKNLQRRSGRTIITNSLPVVCQLSDIPDIELGLTGGCSRASLLAAIGHRVEKSLEALRADQVNIGIGSGKHALGKFMNDLLLGVYNLKGDPSGTLQDARTYSFN